MSVDRADSKGLLLLILLVAGLLLRFPQFGNPVAHIDDQFYLLVGERMTQGAIPYVDIWDRKPIGLFLIYEGIARLGGTGVIQYQLVATLFAVATAYLVARISRPVTSARGALFAGLAYLIYLGTRGGMTGQSPIFYNLPVVAAAGILMRIWVRPVFDRRSILLATFAMLMLGVAIQIKYTVIFEGAFFGVLLLVKGWNGLKHRALIVPLALLWVVIALLPTALAWAWYASRGYGELFVFANFQSIFLRHGDLVSKSLSRLLRTAFYLGPLMFAGLASIRMSATPEQARQKQFIYGWLSAALTGYLVFGTYYNHYALPLIPPLAIAAAPFLGARKGWTIRRGDRSLFLSGPILVLILGVVGTLIFLIKDWRTFGDGAQIAPLVNAMKTHRTGCPYVFDDDVLLYHLSDSCIPTRWPFADHLGSAREDSSIGVDPLSEVQRIMTAKPQLVVAGAQPEDGYNPRTWTYLHDQLAKDYRLIRKDQVGEREINLYQRIPGR